GSDVFVWDASSNNRAFVWGRASIIQNAISASRQAEKQSPTVARNSALARPAAGPVARLMAPNGVHSYVIWKFAESPDLARRFLLDLTASYDGDEVDEEPPREVGAHRPHRQLRRR